MRAAAEVDIQREAPGASSATEIVKRNTNALRAAIIGLSATRVRKREEKEASSGGSKSLPDDPLTALERTGQLIAPPFDLLFLSLLTENNTEIGPCVESLSVNVGSFGWRLAPRLPVNERTPIKVLRTLAEEKVAVENFIESALDCSFRDFRDHLRKDLELTGNSYVEFVEAPGTGELHALNHLPAWTMRLSRTDSEATQYVERVLHKRVSFRESPEAEERDPDLEGLLRPSEVPEGSVALHKGLETDVAFELVEQVRWKRFRRYVQQRGTKVVWFKELGDPRVISCIDGHVVTREEMLHEDVNGAVKPRFTLSGDLVTLRRDKVGWPVELAANPVRHQRIYSSRTPYGLPRFIGDLFCVMGSRAAEEINYSTFKNNNVPSLAITVSNGKLDDDSVERVQEFVESAIAGDDNYSKFLLLEAEPVMEGMRDPGAMKIDITPLTREQHTDALFTKYKESNDKTVRRAWRIPPVFLGDSDDFSSKTVDPARRLGDEQVFSPERERDDSFFTRDVLIRYLGVAWSTFKSNSANITENQDMVRLISSGEKTGGVTPRIARQMLSRVTNEDLGEVDPSVNPDVPFSLTLAQLMKSDSATSAPGGGESTSQGRAGLQVGGDVPRDRASEPAGGDSLERLAQMLKTEAARRFGGYVPPVFEDEPDLEDVE